MYLMVFHRCCFFCPQSTECFSHYKFTIKRMTQFSINDPSPSGQEHLFDNDDDDKNICMTIMTMTMMMTMMMSMTMMMMTIWGSCVLKYRRLTRPSPRVPEHIFSYHQPFPTHYRQFVNFQTHRSPPEKYHQRFYIQ